MKLSEIPDDKHKELRGCWVQSKTMKLGILRTIRKKNRKEKVAVVLWPSHLPNATRSGISYFTPLEILTLRDDLPRAWHPDGAPPTGEKS